MLSHAKVLNEHKKRKELVIYTFNENKTKKVIKSVL